MCNKSKLQTRFFLIAFPRSGSSLLRALLNTHSQVVVPPECGYIHHLSTKYSDQQLTIGQWWNLVSSTRKFETWDVNQDMFVTPENEHILMKFDEFVDRTQLAYAQSRLKSPSVWGDKNNYYSSLDPKFTELIPGSKRILLVRNPYDVVKSIQNLKTSYLSPYAPRLDREPANIINKWVLMHEKWIPASDLIVHYDLLTKNPTKTLSQIFEYLQLPYESVQDTFYLKNDEPEQTSEWKEKVFSPIISHQQNSPQTEIHKTAIQQEHPVLFRRLHQLEKEIKF